MRIDVNKTTLGYLRPRSNYTGPRTDRSNKTANRGFTMIEIAICLAVIGIALVAIIGVLPSGFNIKRDNRTDTIIYHDARFLIEAIKNGARGAGNLNEHFELLNGKNASGLTTEQIIGTLSAPDSINEAVVRAIAGTPTERSPQTKDLAFRYFLVTELKSYNPNNSPYASSLQTNLYELKLKFYWPVLPNGVVVTNSANTRIFRTLVSGPLIVDTNSSGGTLYFFARY